MPTEAFLVNGPQDGARVKAVGGVLPFSIHVGPKWLGDGYAAWGRQPSQRFPACYLYDGKANYFFAAWLTESRLTPEDEDVLRRIENGGKSNERG